jgi:hypothetical protein
MPFAVKLVALDVPDIGLAALETELALDVPDVRLGALGTDIAVPDTDAAIRLKSVSASFSAVVAFGRLI